MIWGDDGYAPISLPETIDILPANGAPVRFDATAIKVAVAAAAQVAGPAASPEERRALEQRLRALQDAQQLVTLAGKQPNRTQLFQLVQDIVWWRRVVYFVTVT